MAPKLRRLNDLDQFNIEHQVLSGQRMIAVEFDAGVVRANDCYRHGAPVAELPPRRRTESLPGFGQSARPDWIISVRDLAAWVTWFVRDLRLSQPLNVIGGSMGGWIAAVFALTADGVR